MCGIQRLILAIILLGCGSLTAAPPDQGPVFIDPAQAGPDLSIQGEYTGSLDANGRRQDWGVQVIALGGGQFQAVAHSGGLPGAGWNGSEKLSAEGKTTGDVTTFVVEKHGLTARVRGNVMSVNQLDGRLLGTLERIERESPTLGAKPPPGAVVLFDGTDADQFVDARMTPDGLLMEPATSKRLFQSVRCHVEFLVPFIPQARGQARGNNGFFCQGRYQVQILDSFGLEGTYKEGGSIYGVAAPTVNMCLPPLAWQTFDIDFTAARFEDGQKIANARMTVHYNGVLVHNDVEVPDCSSGALLKEEDPSPGPIYVQSHNAPLRFRNVWVVEKD